MTPLYEINLNLNTPHIWHIDTNGRDPKWLVEAMNLDVSQMYSE